MHAPQIVDGVFADLLVLELEPLGVYLDHVEQGVRDLEARRYRSSASYARRLLRLGVRLAAVQQCARRHPSLLEILESMRLERMLADPSAPAHEVLGRFALAR
jgi:hypothetical protein